MNVEVVFALPERQELISISVDPDATVDEVISKSKIGDKFPDEDISNYETGIWGKPVDRSHRLRDGDRLEIYRPLSIDPREARRKLAKSGKSMGQAAGSIKDPH